MSKENYVLSEDEFNAVDKVIMATKLDGIIMITQTEDGCCDYFDDLEEGKKLSLAEGLEIINDAMFDDDYGLSEAELTALNSLLERYVNKEA